jgi:RNA polymerase sigma-70 factor (ECF subfamily)
VGRFEGRSQLSTWLYRIAYNAALMRLRRRPLPTTSIDEPIQNEDGDLIPRQLVDWTGRPDEILLTGELRGVLNSAAATLPETLRSVFALRDIEGLSTAETAEVLGLTETNVKVRLHRARLALRERLTSYFMPIGAGGRQVGGAYVGRM